MPAPSVGPTAADRARLQRVTNATNLAARRQRAMPQPEDSVNSARTTVVEPTEESSARAEAGLVAALEQRPAPSPAILQLCEQIRTAIRNRRPPDEESLARSNPAKAARSAGGEVESSVRADANAIRSDYDQLGTAPAGTPARQAQPLNSPPARVATPNPDAASATPDPVPAEQVNLDADVAASEQRARDAGMRSPAAQLVQSGPVAEARSAQSEFAELAATDPAQVLAEQAETRNLARADMIALEQQALAALQTSRAASVAQQTGSSQSMARAEEQQRQRAAGRAKGIFQRAQQRVAALLEPLPQTAMSLWESGLQSLSNDFERTLQSVENWKRERYSQLGGSLIKWWDETTGLPRWVSNTYDDAEKRFGDGICRLLAQISTRVNGVIATCEAIIARADRDIAAVFNDLPVSLQSWAQGQQTQFRRQLDSLRERVNDSRDQLNNDLAERSRSAVQKVRERVHKLRQSAKGLIGRIQAAIGRFLANPARFVINGLLALANIAAATFWSLVDRLPRVIADIAGDPLGFANNLGRAIGAGFGRFFANFRSHILGGFFDWLFSGLGAVGVNIPADARPRSLITFFLELMGITWDRIRALLGRLIGEENIERIQQAWQMMKQLIELGPSGLFELIRERFNPREIIQQVIQASIDFLVETLIVRVTARLLAMFNPVGAIIAAIQAIHRILSWIFNNAARLFGLIETVVNGAAALVAGNIGGMATAIESSLARLVAPVIDFFADLLGLGDLPQRIAATIRGFQQRLWGLVEGAIRSVADRVRGLFAARRRGANRDANAAEAAEATQRDGAAGRNSPATTTDVGGAGSPSPRYPRPPGLASLDEPPAAMPRSSSQQREDLAAAVQVLGLVARRAETSEDLAAYFSRIQRRFQLTSIGFVPVGDHVELALKINPQATIKVTEQAQGRGIAGMRSQISYSSGRLAGRHGGDTVGLEMVADPLGPDHPAGSGPSGQQNLMALLETDKGLPGTGKYVRGHLLNDRVGGEGSPRNLFPITAQANAAHERAIESRVKQWVNSDRYWVYYRVRVTQNHIDLSHPEAQKALNKVDARLECNAAIYDLSGGKVNAISATIASVYRAPDDAEVVTAQSGPDRRREVTVKTRAEDHSAQIERSTRESEYRLHATLFRDLQALARRHGGSLRAVPNLRDRLLAINEIGTTRVDNLMRIFDWSQRNNRGDIGPDLDQSGKSNLTVLNRKAVEIGQVLNTL